MNMVMTSAKQYDNGDVKTVYRDKVRNICVEHVAAYRGGCLYMGSITVRNQSNARAYTFCSQMGPTDDDRPTARAYFGDITEKHLGKIV